MEEPQIEDAVNYMNEVGQFRRMNQCFQIKERFKDDEERYKDFLSIMIELKDKGYQKLCFCLQCRIGDRSVIQRLNYVFEGNTDLLKKFTMFLPPDYDTDFLFDQPFYHHFNHVLLEQCFFSNTYIKKHQMFKVSYIFWKNMSTVQNYSVEDFISEVGSILEESYSCS